MLTSVQPREAARPYGEDEDGKYTIPSCPALRYIMWPAGYGPANHLEASAAALKRTCTLLRLAARRRRQSSNDSEAKRTLNRQSKPLRIGNISGNIWRIQIPLAVRIQLGVSQGRCRPVWPSLRTLSLSKVA